MPKKMKRAGKKRRVKYIYRSAKTGKIVTAAYARAHPGTTVRETVVV